MPRELYFASSNKNKVEEAESILGFPINLVRTDVKEVQSLDLEEAVRQKVTDAFQISRTKIAYLHNCFTITEPKF